MRARPSLLLLVLAACASEAGGGTTPTPEPLPEPLPPLAIPAGCNPLASEHDCLLPFPSDQFLRRTPEGATTLFLPTSARPRTIDGVEVDFSARRPAAGFSPLPQLLALFPEGVDPAPLARPWDELGRSLDAASPTVLLDAETGERILHLAETDPLAARDDRRALLIRPLVRLRGGARYVVAIRGLTTPAGEAIAAPEGFRRLRDGVTRGDPILAPIAARWEEELFPPLAAAGVDRAALQLAWDFTVRPDAEVQAGLLAVRALTLDWLAAHEVLVTDVVVKPGGAAGVAFRVEGVLHGPLVTEADEPFSPLARDEAGAPRIAGTARIPFLLVVPEALAGAGAAEGGFVQFGHGFFGSRREIDDGFMGRFSSESRRVVGAIDWEGMSNEDVGGVAGRVVASPAEALDFVDRLHQGMVNQLVFARAARTTLRALPELQPNGAALWPDAPLAFYGLSMGHILGGTYVALAPDVERATLSMGGASFAFIMFRARPFLAFLDLVKLPLPDPLDRQKFAALAATSWDPIDPATWAPHVVTDLLPGVPAGRRLLVHDGLGDAAVNNLATHVHVRSLGIPLLTPAVRALPGIAEAPLPHDGSGFVEFDFGIDPLPGLEARPADADNEVHGAVRDLPASRRQVARFFDTGTIEATCEGPCDPE